MFILYVRTSHIQLMSVWKRTRCGKFIHNQMKYLDSPALTYPDYSWQWKYKLHLFDLEIPTLEFSLLLDASKFRSQKLIQLFLNCWLLWLQKCIKDYSWTFWCNCVFPTRVSVVDGLWGGVLAGGAVSRPVNTITRQVNLTLTLKAEGRK